MRKECAVAGLLSIIESSGKISEFNSD